MTHPPLPDRWTTRDLPVLVAAARRLDNGELPVTADTLAEDLGTDVDSVFAALDGLTPGYLASKPINTMGGRAEHFVTALTERGRRTVGLWPSAENTVDALEEALRAAEASTDDPEERGAIRRALGAITSVSREVMVDVVASVVAKQSGLG